jgi:hypothetical protein
MRMHAACSAYKELHISGSGIAGLFQLQNRTPCIQDSVVLQAATAHTRGRRINPYEDDFH